MSSQPPGWRHKTHEEAGDGLTIAVWELARKACRPLEQELWDNAPPEAAAIRMVHAAAFPVPYRQLCLQLRSGSVLLKPGAFQYATGSITAEVHKSANAAGVIARRVTTSAAGQSATLTRCAGQGEIWTQPSPKHFLTIQMHGAEDALLLNAEAFYACEGTITVSTQVHGSVQGLVAGTGPMRPMLSGRGVVVMECPVPPSEIAVITLDGRDELTVQGDLMLAYSASLEVTLRPLVGGTQNVLRSTEGLVYAVRGQGKVLLVPTRSLGY